MNQFYRFQVLKFVYTLLKVFFSVNISERFSFFTKPKKDKRPSLSYSNEKFMLGCLDDKYSLNVSVWSREENHITAINIPSIEYRLQTTTAIFELFIFTIAHKNVSQRWTQCRPNSHTIDLSIVFTVKHKNGSLAATLNKLRKTSLGILGGF